MRGKQGQRHGTEEWQYHHWNSVDAAKNWNKRGFSFIAGWWTDETSHRYTQQYHRWSLEYWMPVDYLKTIQISYNATRGERLRCRVHFIQKWKNPTKLGNMSIHENFRDAVRQRAVMAHQGEGYTPASLHRKGFDSDPSIHNYVLNSETSINNGVICASSSVEHRRCRHRHRRRHGGIRNTGEVLNGGESGNKMSGKIKSGWRRGKYRRPESSLLWKMLHIRSSFFFSDFVYRYWRMSCTRRGVNTEHFVAHSTHAFFLVAHSTVVSHLTFHPMHLLWLKAWWIKSAFVSCIGHCAYAP